MSKELKDLAAGDTCYIFGGARSGATGGIEQVVAKVGRDYLYVRSPSNEHAKHIVFSRTSGVEKDSIGATRILVVDRDAWILKTNTAALYNRIKNAMTFKVPEGVTLDGLHQAAKLLGLDFDKKH
jgi:hypothetical protein